MMPVKMGEAGRAGLPQPYLAKIDEKQYGDARFLIYSERKTLPVSDGKHS